MIVIYVIDPDRVLPLPRSSTPSSFLNHFTTMASYSISNSSQNGERDERETDFSNIWRKLGEKNVFPKI